MVNRNYLLKVVILNEVVSAITQVGFPIVMVLLMWYLFIHFYDSIRDEMGKLRDTISENTEAMHRLIDKYEGGENDNAEL